MAGLSVATLAAGAFICVAGTYVIVKQMTDAYGCGQVTAPFDFSARNVLRISVVPGPS